MGSALPDAWKDMPAGLISQREKGRRGVGPAFLPRTNLAAFVRTRRRSGGGVYRAMRSAPAPSWSGLYHGRASLTTIIYVGRMTMKH